MTCRVGVVYFSVDGAVAALAEAVAAGAASVARLCGRFDDG